MADLTTCEDALAEITDLRILMCSASAAVQRCAAHRGCRVRLELPADPLLVHAKPQQLELALVNLLRTAIDSDSTRITLIGDIDDDDRVEVRVDDDGRRDQAPPDVLDDDLAAIVQWSAELVSAAARAIIEEHGGRLTFVARPGGACARFSLPRNAAGSLPQ
jgi:signal transduction histidine kinase